MNGRKWFLLGALFLSLLLPSSVLAHRADFIDETLVYLTVESGGLEPEYWLDFGNDGGGSFTRHNLSLEYGLTDHWMVEGRGTVRSPAGDQTSFDSARLETRYRFFEEGEKPIDVAVSGEVNTQRLADGSTQQGFEPRLILSRDFEALNLTLNLGGEIPLAAAAVEFEPSFGIRYDLHGFFSLGSEFKYDTTTQEGSVVPQGWVKFPGDATFKMAYSAPFDQNRESFWRFVLEVEFQTGPSKPKGDKDED